MQYSYLGNSGLRVSRVCLGTATFSKETQPGKCDEATAHALLDQFVAAGGNFIDTADVYCDGESERIVGRWLVKQPRRQDLVIATKVAGYTKQDNGPNSDGASRQHILAGLEGSLARLQTSYIDLYQLHRWDPGTPLEETLRTLTDLVRAGKVRYIGVSNFTGWQLQKTLDYCRFLGLEPAVTLQSEYSLLSRGVELELAAVCRQERVGLLPWAPLAAGWLTGKMNRKAGGPPAGSRVAWATDNGKRGPAKPDWQLYDRPAVWRLLEQLRLVALEQGRSAAQVALRWLLQRPEVPAVVVGARTAEQLTDNLAAGSSWQLTDQQVSRLDQLSDQLTQVFYPYDMSRSLSAPRERPAVGY